MANEFFINDIQLDIPPEQISISRKSMNYSWQALRTKSSIKLKSGYSQLDITLRVFVTHEGRGYRKLRDLVSQFRVTPFCYVENDYIRNAIMNGDRSKNMALALKNMVISKSADSNSPDVVEVVFYFSWFNYFPYMSDFVFKTEPFVASSTKTPQDSDAWKLMYLAEQKRAFKEGSQYLEVDQLGMTETKLMFTEFQSLPDEKYNLFKREVKSLRRLREWLQSSVDKENDIGDIVPQIYGQLMQGSDSQELLDNVEAAALFEEIFGTTTSIRDKFSGSEAPFDDLIKLLDNSFSESSNSKFSGLLSDGIWKLTQLNTDSPSKVVNYQTSPSDTNNKSSIKERVLERERSITFNDEGYNITDIILTGVSISFQNILAVLPIKGFTYPTFQHIGSVDAVVTLSFITNNDTGLAKLSNFYNTIESQAINAKQIPQGQRNLRINNDLINMCGLREFIPENFSSETIQGSPGSSNVVITLLDNPITSTKKEELREGKDFSSIQDVSEEVRTIITNNLQLINDAFIEEPILLGLVGKKLKLRNLKKGEISLSTLVTVKKDVATQAERKVNAILSKYPSAAVTGTKFGTSDIKVNFESGYFVYNGSQRKNDMRFKKLCIEYGQHLGDVLAKVIDLVYLWEVDGRAMRDLNLLRIATNDQIPSIGIIKNIVEEILYSFQSGVRPNTSSYDVGKTEEEVNETFMEHFADWITWSNQFINKIITSTDITLPQFASVYAKILIQLSKGDIIGYPDFPLFQVVNLIRDNNKWSKTLNKLTESFTQQEHRNVLRGTVTNITSLINPDFYMFNNIDDTANALIPAEMIHEAKDSIVTSHNDLRSRAEKDWFKNVYEKNILGDSLAAQVNTQREIASLPIENKEKREKIEKELQTIDKIEEVFKATDLDIGESLGSTIAERKNTTKEPVNVSARTTGAQETGAASSWNLNNRTDTELLPVEYWHEAKHRFGLEVLETDVLPKDLAEGIVHESAGGVKFVWPTGPETRRITSKFSKDRPHPTEKNSKGNPIIRDHKGFDLGSTNRQGSLGNRVYAVADGKVTHVSYSEFQQGPKTNNLGSQGISIVIQHKDGHVTKYYHLLWSEETKKLSDEFWGKGEIWEGAGRRQPQVIRNKEIGLVGNTGIGTAAHLHFEVWKNGVPIDPETIYKPQFEKLKQVFADTDPNNGSLLTKSVEQFEKNLYNGQGFGLIRAYPTYRLYFIESDIDERKRYQFDDFFSYSSVVNIELIRSRKLAADLLTLTLTNTSGVLSNRKFRNSVLNPNKARDSKGNIAKEESSIASFMLRPGTQIQLALGYSNNVKELDTPFNGVITDVQFSADDQLIEVTCQSFGIQLVQNMHGEVKSYGGWLSNSGITGEILENLMASPELTHFGRWVPGTNPPKGEYRSVLQTRWTFLPQPKDDNIFAPTGRGVWGFFDSSPKFILYQTTIWDAMQELTLRHPGMIAYPVPYEGEFGSRMTMFFGVPDQLYFARDPNPAELDKSKILQEIAISSVPEDEQELQNTRDSNKKPNAQKLNDSLNNENTKLSKEAQKFWLDKMHRRLGLASGFIKPFRSYHLITSNQHIIYNNIKNSLYNTFNTATIQYSDDNPKPDKDRGGLGFGDAKTFTLRCDAALPDEEVRELFAQFPNCVGEEIAKRYCLSLLKNSLKEGYKGNIVITGNAAIKPYDICYIFDQFNDMYGPIEVEQVVHSFSQQTGFVTEITPDMCVHVNEHCTMATQDALGLVVENWLKGLVNENSGTYQTVETIGSGISTVLGLVTAPIANMFFNTAELGLGLEPTSNPFKLVGTFIFSKAVTRSQCAHPFRYSPLVQAGQSLLGGLPKQLDITFIQGIKKSFKDGYKGARLLIGDTYDKLKPNSWVGRTTGDFGLTYFSRKK